MDVITLKQLAEELGKDRSALRKWVIAQGFTFIRVRTPGSQGQQSLAFTPDEAQRVRERLASWGYGENPASEDSSLSNVGYFYAIQVVPDLAPNRVKLGFAQSVRVRLGEHRTAAPTAALLKAWPSRRTWEIAAIESITRSGASLILNEVYEFDDLDGMISRADEFFSIMPNISVKGTDDAGINP